MADDISPEDVSERAMFASGSAPIALPMPVAVPRLDGTETHDAGPTFRPDVSSPATIEQRRRQALGRILSPSGIAKAAQTEIDRGTAFVLFPIPLATGALIYFSASHEPALAPLIAGAACLAGLVGATRARPAVNLTLAALLLIVLGVVCGKAETWRSNTKMLGAEITTQLTGRLIETERMSTGRIRLTIDVISTARPMLRYAPDRVRVSARQIPDEMVAGSVISGLVRLMPPSGPVRPGSYDFSFKSYFDGIGASGFFLRGPELASTPVRAAPSVRFQAMVERWRAAIAARIANRIGGAEGEIAAALVVGVRAGIPDEVNDALRRAGIYHIISISGLHMALVAGTIMGLLRAGFALFPGFSSRHPVKKYAAALAILGIAAYLFISGAEVAAKRSFIMLAVMLTAVLFDRAALTLRNLAISAIVVIAISPHEVGGPSFQMSFAATAALVGAYAAWSDYRARRPSAAAPNRTLARSLLRKATIAAGGLAMTSLVAGTATAIYAAYHFQQMPSLGLFTNLAAMPIVSTLVMPFAVLGTLAMPFHLDGLFFDVMGIGLAMTVAIARWFAERSPIDIVGPIAPAAVVLLTAALAIAAVGTTWLRAAALPLALAGLVLLPLRTPPDLLISEDARLLGLTVEKGGIAVNRNRPNQFTIENWQRAVLASTIVKPEVSGSNKPRETGRGFVCDESLCTAKHVSGATIAYAADLSSAASACDHATIIVIDDATAKGVCKTHDALIITKRDLARWGSAAVKLPSTTGNSRAEVEFAVSEPYRPWHMHRRYSREARGLAPYRFPKKSQPTSADTNDENSE